jgi:hypothetical protein
MGGGGADAARQLALEALEEDGRGVGHVAGLALPLGLAAEEVQRGLCPEDALGEDEEVLGSALLRARTGRARAFEDLHEGHALEALDGLGKVTRETTRKPNVLRRSDQTSACRSGSRPSMPNSASGRSQLDPRVPGQGAGRQDGVPKEGRRGSKSRRGPEDEPGPRPGRRGARQKRPPSMAGRICATPVKAISPIELSATSAPVSRK